jgi:hypothetical protein
MDRKLNEQTSIWIFLSNDGRIATPRCVTYNVLYDVGMIIVRRLTSGRVDRLAADTDFKSLFSGKCTGILHQAVDLHVIRPIIQPQA